MNYDVTPHAYLARARERLLTNEREDLFYAALELRCCVEVRQSDYFEALEKYRGVKIKGWKVGDISRKLSVVWPDSKIARLTYGIRGKEFKTYFTPVPLKLARAVEKELGALLHAQRYSKVAQDEWWQGTRSRLIDIYRKVWLACRGEHMAPPIWGERVGEFHSVRLYTTPELEELVAFMLVSSGSREQFAVHIEHLDKPPDDWQCDL